MITLREMDEARLRQVYDEQIRRDFPPSELKHLSTMLALKARGEYDTLEAYLDSGEYIGYALVYHPHEGRELLLDYLAIREDMRGRGYGHQLMETLGRYYRSCADSLMIECERPKAAPDEAIARRRIRFYEESGAILTPVRIWLFDVEYSILVLPCNPAKPGDWAEQMLGLYRQMLPPDLYARNVRLIRG